MVAQNELVMELKEILGHQPWSALGAPSVGDMRMASAAALQEQARPMSKILKSALLDRIASALESKAVVSREDLRIAFVKLTIALLPDSLNIIRMVIMDQQHRYDPELRFSLFCFLGEVLDLSVGEEAEREICGVVSLFLLEARKNSAQAPWMAGDLLGAHWRAEPGISALCDVAKRARFVAGREAGIHGLSHALETNPSFQGLIRRVLSEIAREDRSGRIRRYARSVLEGKHC